MAEVYGLENIGYSINGLRYSYAKKAITGRDRARIEVARVFGTIIN